MYVRPVLLAAALSLALPAHAADSGSARPQPASQPAGQQVQAVMASAEAVKVPAALKDAQFPAPKRPRAARVTTCRCGEPSQQ